ncbi:hypothetical protein N7462_009029 [Penicillium macrosclerotiorum]|uniref:uncharacterized protein n=1 Tax=Penicillium macrosclerotiorum TaxID=303699 RepID=UPI0025482EE7|nr:uncharacterized protein N7462_009029 [Penicillium macrosclerotiorum]KAJ5676132.1 hypothetical protein N7462_009029 [Penicillium macrosclerotiorum]
MGADLVSPPTTTSTSGPCWVRLQTDHRADRQGEHDTVSPISESSDTTEADGVILVPRPFGSSSVSPSVREPVMGPAETKWSHGPRSLILKHRGRGSLHQDEHGQNAPGLRLNSDKLSFSKELKILAKTRRVRVLEDNADVDDSHKIYAPS